jgi:RNA polymerase sigma factor (sigma-70 family)
MSDRFAGPLAACVRAAVRGVTRPPGPDADLLAAFVQSRDPAAFEQLVRRHAPLVLSACRHVLANPADVDDACQATFVVLYQKAHTIRARQTIGAWLFRVARRAAFEVRRAARRRQACEARAVRPELVPGPDLSWREACAILHEELDRLPDKYRLPLIACYLEGKTQDEAARELGRSAETLRGRIDRGRAKLGRRLRKRGVTLSAGLLAAATASVAPAVGLPAVLSPSPAVADIVRAVTASGRAAFAVGGLSLAAGLVAGAIVLGAGAGGGSPAPPGPPAKEAVKAAPRLDAFGDPLPAGAVARLGTVRFNHGDGLNGLQYSPDGKWILSSGGGHAHLWDAATGRELRHFTTGKKAYRDSATLTADGHVALVDPQGEREAIHIWDAARGTELRSGPLPGRNDSIGQQTSFSPDGRLCAFSLYQQMVRVMDVETGRELYLLREGDKLRTACLAGNDSLVTADADRQIQVWEARTGKPVRKFDHGGPLGVLTASPDGRLLATLEHHTGAIDKYLDKDVVHVWDLATGQKKHTLAAPPQRWFMGVGLSDDGRKLVALAYADPAPELMVWDTDSGKLLRTIPDISGTKMAFSPDGKHLVIGLLWGKFEVLDLETGRQVTPDDGRHALAAAVALSAAGDRAVVTGYHSITTWDANTGRRLKTHELPHFGSMNPTRVYSPDGQYAVTYDGDYSLGRLVVREADTDKALMTIDPGISPAAFSPDSRQIAVAHWDSASKGQSFRVYDVRTGKVAHTIRRTKAEWVKCLSLVDGGQTLVASGLRVAGYSVADGRELFSWGIPRAEVNDKAVMVGGNPDFQPPWRVFTVSPNGTLAAGLREFEDFGRNALPERLFICDARTGRVLHRCNDSGRKGSNWGAVRFSADSRLLASSDGYSVHLWEAATGKRIRTITGHEGEIADIAFSGNGRRLATASYDCTVLIWDLSAPAAGVPAEWLADLLSDDAAKAYAAVWRLADAADDVSLPIFREHLRPVTAADMDRVRKAIADLDSDQFRVRDRAFKELTDLGHQAAPALRAALGGKVSVEARNRIERLLANTAGPPSSGESLRTWRALAALEAKGTAGAKQLLRELAAGASGAWLTEEAKASLRRAEADSR